MSFMFHQDIFRKSVEYMVCKDVLKVNPHKLLAIKASYLNKEYVYFVLFLFFMYWWNHIIDNEMNLWVIVAKSMYIEM